MDAIRVYNRTFLQRYKVTYCTIADKGKDVSESETDFHDSST